MKPDLRARALKAHYLTLQNITGVELAKRLKITEPRADGLGLYDPDAARELAAVGKLIERAEASRLTKQQRDVLKVICRVVARNVMSRGIEFARIADVDFAAGKRRSGWCGKQLTRLTIAGLVVTPEAGRVRLTNAGWAFAWATGLIKPTWKVPT